MLWGRKAISRFKKTLKQRGAEFVLLHADGSDRVVKRYTQYYRKAERVTGVIGELLTNHRDSRQAVNRVDLLMLTVDGYLGFTRARSIAAATSSLNSSALCNAPLILTISISRAAICPAGSL